ncbi:hypothetical protein B0H13DRAFT_1856258 [Mycena leptocephala]|nr:hypothetical protein B0H13DRAFT_1856258 [Mycena leptocephala]
MDDPSSKLVLYELRMINMEPVAIEITYCIISEIGLISLLQCPISPLTPRSVTTRPAAHQDLIPPPPHTKQTNNDAYDGNDCYLEMVQWSYARTAKRPTTGNGAVIATLEGGVSQQVIAALALCREAGRRNIANWVGGERYIREKWEQRRRSKTRSTGDSSLSLFLHLPRTFLEILNEYPSIRAPEADALQAHKLHYSLSADPPFLVHLAANPYFDSVRVDSSSTDTVIGAEFSFAPTCVCNVLDFGRDYGIFVFGRSAYVPAAKLDWFGFGYIIPVMESMLFLVGQLVTGFDHIRELRLTVSAQLDEVDTERVHVVHLDEQKTKKGIANQISTEKTVNSATARRSDLGLRAEKARSEGWRVAGRVLRPRWVTTNDPSQHRGCTGGCPDRRSCRCPPTAKTAGGVAVARETDVRRARWGVPEHAEGSSQRFRTAPRGEGDDCAIYIVDARWMSHITGHTEEQVVDHGGDNPHAAAAAGERLVFGADDLAPGWAKIVRLGSGGTRCGRLYTQKEFGESKKRKTS